MSVRFSVLGLLALLGTAAPVGGATCSDTAALDAAQRLVDAAVPCAGPRRAYVRKAKQALRDAPLSRGCRKAFIAERIVQSACGRGGVICCQKQGKKIGTFKPKASRCTGRGTICTGGSSVGTACAPAGGCATTTTTTTSTTTTSTTTTTTTTTGPAAVCPARTDPALPRQVTFTVPASGGDLDNGWAGTFHNLPFVAGATLNYCLDNCDGAADTLCDGVGDTASVNTAALGAPLPLLAANVPVCVVMRFQDATLRAVYDLATGHASADLGLFSDVYLTNNPTEVCPRCIVSGGGGLGSDGTCSGTARTPGAACVVDGEITITGGVGDPHYLLSSTCTPVQSQLAATNDLELALTTGPSSVSGSMPCPDLAGAQSSDDACGAAGTCTASCTGAACMSRDSQGRCIDAKGGISQLCCSNVTDVPCFSTRNGGSIERTGSPARSGQTGALAGTFCIPRTDSALINTVSGLPGPGAAILPVQASVLSGP